MLLALLLLALAALGLWQAAKPRQASLQQQVQSVASGLRCPSCEGQSVAASESDLARQMRGVAAQQLAAGRTPEQVRSWFADRYGESVLLDPPLRGVGVVLRLLPLVLLPVGAALMSRRRPRRLPWVAGALLVGAVVSFWSPGLSSEDSGSASRLPATRTAATLPVLPPEAATSPVPSPSPWGTAVPTSGQSEIRRALEALKAGNAAEAERLARAALGALDAQGTAAPDATLVLGLAQRQQGDPQATDTLQAFLRMAPKHPAAARVRQLLGEGQ